MGEPWMMFTQDQFQELIDNTNSVWSTISNKNGRIFISKIDIYKSIFLPAAGLYQWASNNVHGEHGVYWSTTYKSYHGITGYFNYNSEIKTTDYQTYLGLSIRPIAPSKP